MPVQPTYPGVYIRELPSGSHTITGVSTSVTSFVGRAQRGPIDTATVINSFADFQRTFGGLWKESSLGYAVRDFFTNGGSQAIIVRVFNEQAVSPSNVFLRLGAKIPGSAGKNIQFSTPTVQDAQPARSTSPLNLTAKTAGLAGNNIRYSITKNNDSTFNLVVTNNILNESFPNLTLAAFPSISSALVTAGAAPNSIPETSVSNPLAGGQDITFSLTITDTVAQVTESFTGLTNPTVRDVIAKGNSNNGNGGKASSLVEVISAPINTPAVLSDTHLTSNTALSTALFAVAPLSLGLDVIAKKLGSYGNDISCEVTRSGGDSFDLTITDGNVDPPITETYTGLTLNSTATLLGRSNLVMLASPLTKIPAKNSPISLVNGTDFSLDLALFQAASPGLWGNQLQLVVDYNVSADIAARYGLETTDLFNLTITDSGSGTSEQFSNLSIKPSPGNATQILAQQSNLVRINPEILPASRPLNTRYQFSGGYNGAGLKDLNILGNQAEKTGLYALENINVFNLLCIPGYLANDDVDDSVLAAATAYCVARKAFYVVDAPSTWNNTASARVGVAKLVNTIGSDNARNAAAYYPRVQYPDPVDNNQLKTYPACGMIAGMMAKIDGQRGVWKAPAGLETSLTGITQLAAQLNDTDSGQLNPVALNCLRTMPAAGTVIWGSRTLQGNDILSSQWKYIPVRRTALYIEQSVYFGTQWAVFEPNDAPLWRQLTASISSFMNGLFKQGAFQGQNAADAYFVKCDSETNTQTDIDNGIVNITIGFAPLKPAEFVIISIQQIAGKN
jgi:phage tail sheath protein FI